MPTRVSALEAWGVIEPHNLPKQVRDMGAQDLQLHAMWSLHRATTHRGCDVRLASGALYDPGLWPRRSSDPSLWRWRVVLSYAAAGAHINVLELLALKQAVRWRLRAVGEVGCRLAHLSDSQVVISVVSKGRSSSRSLNRLLRQLQAHLLASGVTLSLAFVRSALNPADRPSRWRKGT